jgi:hypothetical protein
MSYYQPKDKAILKLIKRISVEKPYTHLKGVCSVVPKDWKLRGCGTGNIQNCLVQLYRRGFIATAEHDPAFYEGTYVGSKIFHLTPKGYEELIPFYLKPNFWIFLFSAITAISTLGAFLLPLLIK